MSTLNILHIALDFDVTSGITTYLLTILPYLQQTSSVNVHLMTNKGNALDIIKGHGIKVVTFPIRRGLMGITNYYATVQFLRHYCHKYQIHIVHTHHRVPEYIAVNASKKLCIGTVTTAHSLVEGWKTLSYKSQQIIAVSNVVRSNIESYFKVPNSKISVIYNPLKKPSSVSDTEIIKVKNQLDISKLHTVILYCGRFNKEKGLEYLIEAFLEIVKKKSHCVLLLVGKENLKNVFIQKLDNTNMIISVPPQMPIDVYYSLADIVVLPTLKDSFPYVMLEAGIHRKAFIGSAVGGIREFIEPNKDALLVAPADTSALLSAILALVNNSQLRIELGNNLFLKVKKTIPTVQEYCNKLLTLYKKLTIPY